jgi:hypothetical protein
MNTHPQLGNWRLPIFNSKRTKTFLLLLFCAVSISSTFLFLFKQQGTMNVKRVLTNGMWISSPTQTEWGLLTLGHIFFNDNTAIFVTLPEGFPFSEGLPQDGVKGSWETYRNNRVHINYGKGDLAHGQLSKSNQSYILTVLSDDERLKFHRVEMTSAEKHHILEHVSKEIVNSTTHPDSLPHFLLCASLEELLSKKEKDIVLHTMMNIHQAKIIWQASLTPIPENVEPGWADIRDYLGVTGSIGDLPSPCGGRYVIGEIGKPVRYIKAE